MITFWGPHLKGTAIPALSEMFPKWHFLTYLCMKVENKLGQNSGIGDFIQTKYQAPSKWIKVDKLDYSKNL